MGRCRTAATPQLQSNRLVKVLWGLDLASLATAWRERESLMQRDQATPPKSPPPPSDPWQYGIIDLFAILTLAALISAMAAPLFRHIQPVNRPVLVIVMMCQVLITAGTIIAAAGRRKSLLELSGQRIALGYCGQMKWRYWPLLKSILYMTAFAAAQVGLALLIAYETVGGFLLYQLQLGYVTGFAFSRYLWRVYPNTIEFFENGISTDATTFLPWGRTEVRPSQYHGDRVVVVERPMAGSIAGFTRTAQLPRYQREVVLAASTVQGRLS